MILSTLPLGFVYSGEIVHPDGSIEVIDPVHNVMPQESVDHVAALLRGTTSVISSWYVFLFENNYTPDSNSAASILQSTIGESQTYDEAARPAWTHAYDGTSIIANSANRAVFTYNATKTVYGAGIISSSAKGGTSGLILSLGRFTTAKSLEPGSEIRIAAGISLVPAA